MNRVLSLLKTDLIQVGRFDHPADHEHRDPPEEFALGYSVSFVEHGEFTMASEKGSGCLRSGSVILMHPEMRFRCTHPAAHPDDVCLCVSFLDTASAEQAIPSIATLAKRKSFQFIRSGSNRLAYLQVRLSRFLARKAEPAAIEALAGEILRIGFDQQDSADARQYSRRQLVWYTDRIEVARQFLDRECHLQHSLSSLAAHVYMSPFHFARVFRTLVGRPPHRYLLERRLLHAAELLRGGLSVTEACFQSGFNNLSHFSRQFRRYFGVHPSHVNHDGHIPRCRHLSGPR